MEAVVTSSEAKHSARLIEGREACVCIFVLLAAFCNCFGQARTPTDALGHASAPSAGERLKESEARLKELVRTEPRNPDYALELGELYLLTGRSALAIPVLQKCLRLAPANWNARIALAQAYQKANNDADALRTLGTTAPAGRRGTFWLFLRAFSLYRLGDMGQALPLFKRLSDNAEMRAPANFFTANCYSEMSRYTEALPYYQAAIRYGQSKNNRALNLYYYDYGLTLFKLGRYRAALDSFEKSIQRFAHDPLPWYYLGQCEAKLGNFDKAKAAFQESIEKDGSFNPAYYRLARLYAKQGDRAKAQELYNKLSKDLDQQLKESEQLKFGTK